MNKKHYVVIAMSVAVLSITSCVSKKKYDDLQAEYNHTSSQLTACEQARDKCVSNYDQAQSTINMQKEQINGLNGQVKDCQTQLMKERANELIQVGDITVLSQTANANLNKTLAQSQYANAAKEAQTKIDSVNLALAANLSSALKDGMNDKDLNIHVQQTSVMIDLSDKMLFTPGKSTLTPEAKAVLAKVAKILNARTDLEVMVEGYTDNQPVSSHNPHIKDNWDLSVLRATEVVRVLQHEYKVDPSRIIAAGRGEYHPIATNDTKAGRAANRHTSIIIMPKLDQFYNLFDANAKPAPAMKPAPAPAKATATPAPAAKPATTTAPAKTTTTTTTTTGVVEVKENKRETKAKVEGVEVQQTTTTTTTPATK